MYNRNMAFTVADYSDLIKLLREHPEWREELRREILDDEFSRLPEYVKQNSADIRALVAETHEFRLASEAHFRRIYGDLSQLKGGDSELKWRFHAAGRFGHRLRRSRVVAPADLELFEDADEAEAITPEEALAVRKVDLFVEGVEGRGAEQRPALLVVEVSVGIESGDIDRAGQRAAILRGLGYNAYGVVAGNRITEATRRYAAEQNVEVAIEIAKTYEQLSA